MKKNERAATVAALLEKHYLENDEVFLLYNKNEPWQLLIATILSAQCTDERVNKVTKKMFEKYDSLKKIAYASYEDIEKEVYSTGFYKNKAKNIVESSKILVEKFDSNLPSDINELLTLPGVGRKTANVIRGNLFKIPSIVVDTHVMRVSNRLGLVKSKNPEKIEFDLMKILAKEQWIPYNTRIITHGRNVCMARSPKCDSCFLEKICKKVF